MDMDFVCSDRALLDILEDASDRDIRLLVKTLRRASSCGLKENCRDIMVIADEIQCLGGHTLANRFRRHGVKYREIVLDVASMLGINIPERLSIEKIEWHIMLAVVGHLLEKTEPAAREMLEANLRHAAGLSLEGDLWDCLDDAFEQPVARYQIISAALQEILTWNMNLPWGFLGMGPAYKATIPTVFVLAEIRAASRISCEGTRDTSPDVRPSAFAHDRRVHPIIETMIVAFDEAEIDEWSPADDPQADQLIQSDLMAFLIASSIDRLGVAEELWRIPYALSQRWGHLDPAAISEMSPKDIADLPEIRNAHTQVSRKDIGKTIVSVGTIVEHKCGGDPAVLFIGSFEEILDKLQLIYGVGPGIARMMIILRMMYFSLVPDLGGELLPKLDTHVQRVFKRTGLVRECNDTEVRGILTGCTARDIAMVDQVAWKIGRECCKPKNPECEVCVLEDLCPKYLDV